MIIDMACNKKEDMLLMKPIPAFRNSKPYNCIEVYEKNKREAIQDNGDFKFLMDYLKKVLKWHQRVISLPEVARYAVPYLELPKYLSTYYEVTEMNDRNYALREAQESLRLQFLGVKPVPKTKGYFEKRDVDYKYEKNVTNHRQKLSKKIKQVKSDDEVESIEDNQFLLYYRVMKIWESIQEQAEKMKDVSVVGSKAKGSKNMFPIEKFSQILVDTPPIPVIAKYDQLIKDVENFKKILKQRGEDHQIERDDADNIVVPSNRPKLFGYPRKWQKLGRNNDS